MKSERGITILNLTIYLMLITIVLAGMAVIRTHFHDNISLISKDGLYGSEFNKLNGFIVQDAKRNYNVGIETNRVDTDAANPHTGTSETKPVVAFKFGNGNVYLYYGNTEKGTVYSDKFGYLNQGVYKYTNQGNTLKIAGGVTDMSVKLETHGTKKRLVIGIEIANGEVFTNMENPMRYTLKYW